MSPEIKSLVEVYANNREKQKKLTKKSSRNKDIIFI